MNRDWQAPLEPIRRGYSSRETVEIECKVVEYRPAAIAIVDGTMEEKIDPETGEITEREKWYWLPRSQIKTEPSTDGRGAVVTMPLWLAKGKGLV